MDKQILSEFQEFLLDKKFIPEKNTSFYAYWVSKFLLFSNTAETLPVDVRIKKFLDQLSVEAEITDWQIRQAYDAIRLYLYHFLKNPAPVLYPNTPEKHNDSFNLSQIINNMREILRLKHYSYKTERSYTDWVRRFYYYINEVKKKNTQTEKLSSDDVRNYLSYLAINKKVSASTQNQAFNSLLFLFRDILNIELKEIAKTVRAKRGIRLPVVLSVEEVRELFKYVNGKNLLILQLLYGSGLRLMELARLRVADIDFDSNLVFVRVGKGDKDRTTMLAENVKENLRLHLREVKSLHEKDLKSGQGEVYLPDALSRKYPNAAKEWKWQYIFPSANLSVDPRSGKIRRHHMSEKSIQNTVRNAAKEAGIAKHVTVHTLRHSFATHLLINGVNIREIQELLGHKNVETTMVYTHVLRDMSNAPKSPLDNLYKDEDYIRA